jgi:zinc and cadmium transporter
LGWLHEIPQELADFGILIHSGLCVRRAVLLNLTSASVAQPFHCWLAPSLRKPSRPRWVPLTAGGFVYLAAADLIPELQHERGLHALVVQTILIALGIAVMGLLEMKLPGDAIAFLQF